MSKPLTSVTSTSSGAPGAADGTSRAATPGADSPASAAAGAAGDSSAAGAAAGAASDSSAAGADSVGTQGSAADAGLRRSFSPSLLTALALLAAVAPLAMDAYLPAFAQMAADLGVSASTTQLSLTTFLVGVALGQLTIGVLSDRLGRRPLLLWGAVLAFVAGVGTALAPGAVLLLVARFFQGLGGAAGMVLGRAVISDRSRGITAAQALSLVMAIQGVAPVVAPVLGGALVGPVGWRGILGVVAAFQGLLVLVVALWVPETLARQDRHDGGLGMLVRGSQALLKDHVFVRLIVINALVYALLTGYLSAAPFVLRNVLGMGTAAYTAVFAVCGLMTTVSVSVCGSLARRISPERQVRSGLVALLAVDALLSVLALTMLGGPVSSTGLMVATVVMLVLHVIGLGTCMGNLPAIALGRTGQWAGTGSALLGFLQFVAGGAVSPLVGLSGEASGTAFGVVVLVLAVVANVLAVFGLRDRGEKERLAARRAEREAHRLGR